MTRENDCISRKELLTEITRIDGGWNMDIFTNEVREIVNDLPSVQPKAIDTINKIREIINISNTVIQEDIIKYKMICEVIENEGYN